MSSTGGIPIKKILVPVDGSDNSKRAARVAANIAKLASADVLIVNVVAPSDYVEMAVSGATQDPAATLFVGEYNERSENEGKRVVDAALADVRSVGAKTSGRVVRLKKGVVESIIDTAAKEKADLIVIGTRGRGGFKRMLMGSVSSGVVTHAPCQVLVVR